ncbi:MAG TPA: PP2C family serine/threonine-protein phosphatase [Candidatus Limnocylindria bacterium]|nr:PP2C family serine/threonine-protein phosphatase [Candidatus Limnocylindria bacterium]
MTSAFRTHRGKVRRTNQDAVLVLPGEFPLFAVADGMGGQRGGNVASAMAVAALKELDTGIPPSEVMLENAFREANLSIYERQLTDDALYGMGTTMTCLWEGDAFVLLCHVGDSRAYRLRGGVLTQLTTDHSLVGELVRSGALTPAQAREYPFRNIITRSVGTSRSLPCETVRLDKRPGDRYLICSDGLTEYADEDDLARALALPPEEAADTLLKAALDAGARDNVSLVILEAAP